MPSDSTPDVAPAGLSDTAEAWPVVASEDLYRGAAPFAVRSDRLHRPDDGPEESFTRIVVEHPGAAVILAVDERGPRAGRGPVPAPGAAGGSSSFPRACSTSPVRHPRTPLVGSSLEETGHEAQRGRTSARPGTAGITAEPSTCTSPRTSAPQTGVTSCLRTRRRT